MWFSSLSIKDESVPYYQQKELECEDIEMRQSEAQNGNNESNENGDKVIGKRKRLVAGYGMEKKTKNL